MSQAALKSPTKASSRVWRVVTLGMYTSVDAIEKSLKSAGYRVDHWVSSMMRHQVFTLAGQKTKIDLVVRSVGDLGFKREAGYRRICVRAERLGYKLCPPEVAPTLRLAYKDQPKGESLRVAMKTIPDPGGPYGIFEVVHDCDGMGLYWTFGGPNATWNVDRLFVFVLPRNKD